MVDSVALQKFAMLILKLKRESTTEVQLLLTHRDPDSIISMLVLHKVLKVILNVNAKVILGYEPYHPQCKRMLEILNFSEFLPLCKFNAFCTTIIMDSSIHDSRLPKEFVSKSGILKTNIIPKNIITLDHHNWIAPPEYQQNSCIDQRFGSCTSMCILIANMFNIQLDNIFRACAAIAIQIDCDGEPTCIDGYIYRQMKHKLKDAFEVYDELNVFEVNPTSLMQNLIYLGEFKTFQCFEISRNLTDHEALLLGDIAKILFKLYELDGVLVIGKTNVHGKQKSILRGRTSKKSNLDKWLKDTFGKRAGARIVPYSNRELPALSDEFFGKIPLPLRTLESSLKISKNLPMWIGGTLLETDFFENAFLRASGF